MKKIFLTLGIIFCLGKGVETHAAQMTWRTTGLNFSVDQQIKADIFLATENQSVNAISGIIHFPSDKLSLQKISDASSLIGLWITTPTELKPGEISFAGIIPGGSAQAEGKLIGLQFVAKTTGIAPITMDSLEVLLNDGLGSSVKTKISPLKLIIGDAKLNQDIAQENIVTEFNRPESFQPEIIKNENVLNNQWALIFFTNDKESGIDHYEVAEQAAWGWRSKIIRGNINWHRAVSPFRLSDQFRNSYIYVKAVDHDGNERVVLIPPNQILSWVQKFQTYLVIIITIIILSLATVIIKRR
ncbi:MAG: hypothetical protein WCK11_03645 [Candidatus Falkowbacteria bacterium]